MSGDGVTAETARKERLHGNLPVIDEVRCYNPACGRMFEPWTNEWFCSVPCFEAYPADRWPRGRY